MIRSTFFERAVDCTPAVVAAVAVVVAAAVDDVCVVVAYVW